jgi:hypothetical protein
MKLNIVTNASSKPTLKQKVCLRQRNKNHEKPCKEIHDRQILQKLGQELTAKTEKAISRNRLCF